MKYLNHLNGCFARHFTCKDCPSTNARSYLTEHKISNASRLYNEYIVYQKSIESLTLSTT
ncbi:hypothetical protein PISMIDRAFT_675764 [Pisolithus microcarpus 441]|uniref:Uncharacterized protein n=1 Tax=Pisolithus microcarpus 441 TaxID=765257 RepID=A0A0C9ZLL3_9AGAM|nr:hypothetical protein PISMIDRAFT_675764 [Pisolithus microcarpus 441]